MALSPIYQDALFRSDLFAGCDRDNYAILVQSLSALNLKKGSSIPLSLQCRRLLTFLADGYIDVSNQNGIIYDTLQSGSLFGIEAFFSCTGSLQWFHGTARSNVVVIPIEESFFLPLLSVDPVINHNLIRLLSQQSIRLAHLLARYTATSPSIRLALFLLQKSSDNSFELTGGFAHLARILDISRATLYRACTELEESGLIARREKKIYILDRKALQTYAGLLS